MCSSLSNFPYRHVASTSYGPSVLFSTSFSHTFNEFMFFPQGEQLSFTPIQKAGKIIVLYIFISTFL
jgi:hypothetical protein